MRDYRDNSTKFAIDLSALKEVISGDLSVNIVKRDVAAKND